MSRGRHATLTPATTLVCLKISLANQPPVCVWAHSCVHTHKHMSVYPDGHFSTLKKRCLYVCVCVCVPQLTMASLEEGTPFFLLANGMLWVWWLYVPRQERPLAFITRTQMAQFTSSPESKEHSLISTGVRCSLKIMPALHPALAFQEPFPPFS